MKWRLSSCSEGEMHAESFKFVRNSNRMKTNWLSVAKNVTTNCSSFLSTSPLLHPSLSHCFRWFYHFYLFATIFYASLAFSVCRVYFWGEEPLFSTKLLLDGIVGNHRHASGKYSLSTKVSTHLSSMPFAVTPESVIVVMLMMVAQVNRRLYECRKLSVYSDAKMNVVHYFFGHSFYFGVGMSVIAEAPGFTGSSVSSDIAMSSGFLKWNHVLGVLIFVVASILQNQSHSILANLRKDKKGNVVTLEHTIPRGGLFTFVSCPHYFAEILIYLSMCLVFAGQSMTWCMVCLFVVSNQIIVGLFNHYWYHQTFKDYPKSRKAVIPFIL